MILYFSIGKSQNQVLAKAQGRVDTDIDFIEQISKEMLAGRDLHST